ncbi:MAG TPA: response regulator, partial [Usitatibacter sp.]|nr:response regulator [Usitatibacter sp.]
MPAAKAKARRVLVVDDNQDAADSLAMLLGVRGEEVRIAYDGAKALEVERDFKPDVVLLDI